MLSRHSLLALLPSSMLTAKPPSLWEAGCVAETPLTHPERHQPSASHFCVLHPTSCNTANTLAMSSFTGYMAGPIVGIRMTNELILAILKYRDSEIGMSAAYICKLYSPGKKKKSPSLQKGSFELCTNSY